MQLVSCLRACQCGPCARACSLARPVWVSPCNLTDDHFCSKGIMTCAGIAKTQGLVLKCTQVHTQQRVAAKGFGQKRSRGGGGLCSQGSVSQHVLPTVAKRKSITPKKREGRCAYDGRPRPLLLPCSGAAGPRQLGVTDSCFFLGRN